MFARVLSVLALAPVVEGLQITTTRLQPLACFHLPALRVPVLVAALYERAEGDEGEVDVDKVNALINERAELREARDFDSADAVRDELIDMGVTVLDKDMVWYVGDRPKGFKEQCTYTRQAGNEVVEVDVEKVEELIMERAFLRRNRDFVGADEVRDALTEIGVRVLDRENEWYAMRKRTPGPPRERDFGPLGHDYTRAPNDKTELTEEVIAEINELIRKRLEAKMARRFEEADMHYGELKEKYNVSVYDGRTKSWRADGGSWDPPGYTRAEGDEGEVDVDAVTTLLDYPYPYPSP